MPHSYVWHDSCLIHKCDTNRIKDTDHHRHQCYQSHIRTHICDMTYGLPIYVKSHDSWLIRTCDMTHTWGTDNHRHRCCQSHPEVCSSTQPVMSRVGMRDFMYINDLSHIWMRNITKWVMWHISIYHVTCIRGSWHTYNRWVMPHIWMSHGTLVNESCDTYQYIMSHVYVGHDTHIIDESCHIYEW